jgi:hypothetical protein
MRFASKRPNKTLFSTSIAFTLSPRERVDDNEAAFGYLATGYQELAREKNVPLMPVFLPGILGNLELDPARRFATHRGRCGCHRGGYSAGIAAND